MQYDTLEAAHDPMGTAISEYFFTSRADRLRVLSSMFEEDEIPVDYLFRTKEQMPELEKDALALAHGNVLDVGAGAGCHALALQQSGVNVKAIDISPLSCDVMKRRGIENVECINLFDPRMQKGYDTILLLMNGTGIAGKLMNLSAMIGRLAELLNERGQVLIDSSDLKYIYETDNGTYDFDGCKEYYGEVDYQMAYKDTVGLPFDWLYVDYPRLKTVAESCGFECELICEGEHYNYLARLRMLV